MLNYLDVDGAFPGEVEFPGPDSSSDGMVAMASRGHCTGYWRPQVIAKGDIAAVRCQTVKLVNHGAGFIY